MFVRPAFRLAGQLGALPVDSDGGDGGVLYPVDQNTPVIKTHGNAACSCLYGRAYIDADDNCLCDNGDQGDVIIPPTPEPVKHPPIKVDPTTRGGGRCPAGQVVIGMTNSVPPRYICGPRNGVGITIDPSQYPDTHPQHYPTTSSNGDTHNDTAAQTNETPVTTTAAADATGPFGLPATLFGFDTGTVLLVGGVGIGLFALSSFGGTATK